MLECEDVPPPQGLAITDSEIHWICVYRIPKLLYHRACCSAVVNTIRHGVWVNLPIRIQRFDTVLRVCDDPRFKPCRNHSVAQVRKIESHANLKLTRKTLRARLQERREQRIDCSHGNDLRSNPHKHTQWRETYLSGFGASLSTMLMLEAPT